MNDQRGYIDAEGEVRELDDHFFANARRGRPRLPTGQKKQQVTMLLDPDVLAHFKKDGKGWQTRVNATLRQAAGLKRNL
tara:strand:+ start:282 stop:518 length:237 start_codon:yes stop_codon:yes gene_type:complete